MLSLLKNNPQGTVPLVTLSLIATINNGGAQVETGLGTFFRSNLRWKKREEDGGFSFQHGDLVLIDSSTGDGLRIFDKYRLAYDVDKDGNFEKITNWDEILSSGNDIGESRPREESQLLRGLTISSQDGTTDKKYLSSLKKRIEIETKERWVTRLLHGKHENLSPIIHGGIKCNAFNNERIVGEDVVMDGFHRLINESVFDELSSEENNVFAKTKGEIYPVEAEWREYDECVSEDGEERPHMVGSSKQGIIVTRVQDHPHFHVILEMMRDYFMWPDLEAINNRSFFLQEYNHFVSLCKQQFKKKLQPRFPVASRSIDRLLMVAFDSVDKERRGYIEKSRVREALQKAGIENVTKEEEDALLSEMSKEEDRIKWSDFRRVVINKAEEKSINRKPDEQVKRLRGFSVLPELDSTTPADKVGYLTKRGGGANVIGVKLWQQRYVILDAKRNALAYFPTREDVYLGVPPKGVLDLTDFKAVKLVGISHKKEHVFSIVPRVGNREYEFCTESNQETKDWAAAIQKIIDSCSPENATFLETQSVCSKALKSIMNLIKVEVVV